MLSENQVERLIESKDINWSHWRTTKQAHNWISEDERWQLQIGHSAGSNKLGFSEGYYLALIDWDRENMSSILTTKITRHIGTVSACLGDPERLKTTLENQGLSQRTYHLKLNSEVKKEVSNGRIIDQSFFTVEGDEASQP